VVAGGRLDQARLAEKVIAWPEHASRMAGAWATPVHQYSAAAPYWLIEIERASTSFGGFYGKAEKHAAGSIEKLAKQSAAAIAACRRGAAGP
jgi:hypothetical protein